MMIIIIIVGRMYDYHVLDMVELGIEKFVGLGEIKVRRLLTTLAHL